MCTLTQIHTFLASAQTDTSEWFSTNWGVEAVSVSLSEVLPGATHQRQGSFCEHARSSPEMSKHCAEGTKIEILCVSCLNVTQPLIKISIYNAYTNGVTIESIYGKSSFKFILFQMYFPFLGRWYSRSWHGVAAHIWLYLNSASCPDSACSFWPGFLIRPLCKRILSTPRYY